MKRKFPALSHLVSPALGIALSLLAALLDGKSARLSREELDRLSALVEKARKEKP